MNILCDVIKLDLSMCKLFVTSNQKAAYIQYWNYSVLDCVSSCLQPVCLLPYVYTLITNKVQVHCVLIIYYLLPFITSYQYIRIQES